MRLWSPVRSDQFGGNGRLREGMFGEISYNYWLITKGRDQTVGWVSPTGTQNLYFNGTSFQPRINNMSTGALENSFTGGATLRFGNMIKHHGWELKTTLMQPQKSSYQGIGGSMDINDDALLYVSPMSSIQSYYYDPTNGPNTRFNFSPASGPGQPANIESGFLWGWYFVGPAAVGLPDDSGPVFALAPLPLTFDRYKLESKVSHWDVEANYIFRAHATRVGFFEFTGGVRYMQLDDNLAFTGWGLPWRGNVRIEVVDPTPGGGDAGDATDFYLEEGILPGTNRDYTYTGTIQGAGTVLADSKWNFKAENHLVGPQVGIRYIKRCTGRWSIIADTKFMAGFNTQNIKSEGTIGSRTAGYDPSALTFSGSTDDITGAGQVPWVPVGLSQTGMEFRHTKTKTEFSPVVDFSLKANWQFTDAIAISAGYQGMFLDNTARSTLVNNYQIDRNGTIFGINDNVNQSTWIHGISAELVFNRF